MDALLRTVGTLKDSESFAIVAGLTRDGSEFRAEVLARSGDTPVVILKEGDVVVAWVATHFWNGIQTIEGYTLEAYRRRGLSRVGAALLVANGRLATREPVAVFSPHCIEMARSLGFSDVRLYERQDTEWVWVSVHS